MTRNQQETEVMLILESIAGGRLSRFDLTMLAKRLIAVLVDKKILHNLR